ncbi:Conserved_hypothetical protein [Hexamita inflata]|uniref:Uncharacterized protein n=1 Tax=Hexamita inflata TaxID=28002 RepID=A0AA86QMQ5_9EUKA|nr:Conserved hypothetical protein [Hexamita inflata]
MDIFYSKISRGEHYLQIFNSRLDNLLASSSLFLLAYYSLFSFKQTNNLLISFPVLLIVQTSIIQFISVLNAVFGFKLRKIGFEGLKRDVFNFEPICVLQGTVLRAVLFPLVLNLIWAFTVIDFNRGEWYVAVIVGVGSIVVGAGGVAAGLLWKTE